VSSAVIDLGSFQTRAGKLSILIKLFCLGYSGEDCPRSVIPSFAGVIPPEFIEDSKQEDDDMKGPKKSKLFSGV